MRLHHWIWYMYCALVRNVNYVQCSHQTLLSPVHSTLEFSFDVVTQVIDVDTDSAQTTPTHSAFLNYWVEPYSYKCVCVQVMCLQVGQPVEQVNRQCLSSAKNWLSYHIYSLHSATSNCIKYYSSPRQLTC